ncbi:MAG: hypothetical protein DMG21_12310 [Acidobacteria bacterium]|nr:MAG: hypothetical protein DMG21_12310 [Acidobacteriota bacterium]
MKSRALNALVAACTLFLLASTAKAQPCANLSLSFNPTSAAPGQSMTVMGSATNCSGTSEALQIQLRLTGPDGISDNGSTSIDLPAGSTYSVSVPFTIPRWAPHGTYTLTATAYAGGEQVATATATATIT